MTESVSFKAYLKREGQEVEVRRFGIDADAATNYLYLQSKIQAVFPSIKTDLFDLFWQDADNDYVCVGSHEELLEAINSATVYPIKLYIKTKQQQQQEVSGPGVRHTHAGITCDSCNGAVVGRRFKCVTCPDFDLCSTCESTGQHAEHFMLRITLPLGSQTNSKYFRKFLGRSHKFFKHNMDTRGHHMGGERPRACPYAFAQPEGPREGRRATGVTDMFDFSALMEFINSLGMSMAAGQREPSEPQAQASTSQASTGPAPEPRQSEGPAQANPVDCLSNLGQAIKEILDPFDDNTEGLPNDKLNKKKTCRHAKSLLKKIKKNNQLWKGRRYKMENITECLLAPQREGTACFAATFKREPHNSHNAGLFNRRVHRDKYDRIFEVQHRTSQRRDESSPSLYNYGRPERSAYGLYGQRSHGHESHGRGPHGHGSHELGPRGNGSNRLSSHGSNFPQPSAGNQGRNTELVFGPVATIHLNRKPQVYDLVEIIDDSSDPEGVDVSFEVRPKNTDTQEAGPSAPAATQSAPAATQSAPAPPTPAATQSAPAPPTPAAQPPNTPRSTGSPVFASAPSPAVTQPPTPRNNGSPVPAPVVEQILTTPPTASARRNSDDWTLLNRESPPHLVDMEVEEGRGAESSARTSAMYPQLPVHRVPPPLSQQDQLIQEATDRILSMGFNFDQSVLKELLKQANCDIASVLEKLLSNRK